jgi:N,N'-diacetyllegionaminate synthase
MDRVVVSVNIAGHAIGFGHPCFIIAEAGVNHNGDLALTRRLIDVAVEAGANAVKFQTYKTELVMSRLAPKASYQLETTDASESQFEMAKALELPADAFALLMAYCEERDILFLSSPFDDESVDLLAGIGVAAFKIPSGEITNLPLLAHVARQGKPMIVSTGMSDLGEVETAVETIRECNNSEIILLHCLSNYPADPASANLRAMLTMSGAFDTPVGYSDHTPGLEVALAAVAMGASVIEKHFTLDRNMPGPDHLASLEPEELAGLVRGIRTVESALGDGRKQPAFAERNTADVARKSLVAACFIPTGTVLTEDLIAIKRPGTGLPPVMRADLIGRSVRTDVPEDALLTEEMLA